MPGGYYHQNTAHTWLIEGMSSLQQLGLVQYVHIMSINNNKKTFTHEKQYYLGFGRLEFHQHTHPLESKPWISIKPWKYPEKTSSRRQKKKKQPLGIVAIIIVLRQQKPKNAKKLTRMQICTLFAANFLFLRPMGSFYTTVQDGTCNYYHWYVSK